MIRLFFLCSLQTVIALLLMSSVSGVAQASGLNDVRALVYSTTAAEVFWRRTNPLDRVEVLRNGTAVGRYDASSYYFGQLDVARGHRIQLRSVDPKGKTSEFVTLSRSRKHNPDRSRLLRWNSQQMLIRSLS